MVVKFFWNGIKVDGGPLIKCLYDLDNNCNHSPEVTIFCKSCLDRLPADLFHVENGTDIREDYVEEDHAKLHPGDLHYKEARAAAVSAKVRLTKRKLIQCERMIAQGRSVGYYMQEKNACLAFLGKHA